MHIYEREIKLQRDVDGNEKAEIFIIGRFARYVASVITVFFVLFFAVDYLYTTLNRSVSK